MKKGSTPIYQRQAPLGVNTIQDPSSIKAELPRKSFLGYGFSTELSNAGQNQIVLSIDERTNCVIEIINEEEMVEFDFILTLADIRQVHNIVEGTVIEFSQPGGYSFKNHFSILQFFATNNGMPRIAVAGSKVRNEDNFREVINTTLHGDAYQEFIDTLKEYAQLIITMRKNR